MGSRPGLPSIAIESTTLATVAANGGLSTWGFKQYRAQYYMNSTEHLSNQCTDHY